MKTYWESILEMRYKSLNGSDLSITNQFNMYVQGLIDGAEAFAIMKNGERFCGAIQTPFKDVRNEILTAATSVERRLR